ncbi:MAG: B12-binding domain-containing radical SAM protein [Desulfovibrionaceae bacterium]|nr:B12-binding domain-containing radical SAM protein [Desulfovibrionaceae bacterium]
MNALLVYPAYPDTFWSFKHVLPFVAKKAAFPPLGLLTVAAMLPPSWEKRLVDVNVAPLGEADLAWADVVLVSAMLVQTPSARDIIARAKAAGKRVVAGGPAFLAQPGRFPGVDHFILGEAEDILPTFLEDLQQGRARQVYEAAGQPDLGSTPLPLWKLVNFKHYVSMSVQYSRGCPFDCEFCGIVAMNGRRPRVKSPQQMLRELQSLYDADWRDTVFIVDDNFIGNLAHVKEFLPLLAAWQRKRGYPYKFMTEASVNLAQDVTLMRMMSAANFHKVFIGIETPSVESLKECGKNQNVATDFASAVRTIHQHGMQVMGGFIVGFDHDTPSIFEQQIRFIQDIGVVTAMVGVLNALPQTRLWRRLQAEDRLVGEMSGENTDASLNFIPRMGRETLLEGYKQLLGVIYSPKKYYQRINTFLAAYNPTARGKIISAEVLAFARSMWSVGVVSSARFAYWRLMFKTLATKRKAFPVAVELAILGLHFERVARRVLRVDTEPET